MNEQEALAVMVAPGARRAGKYREGVIQIHLTRACDKACFACTQGSNLGGRVPFMTVDQFREACRSLEGYFGVVGVFGGNPAMHPEFPEICAVLRAFFPKEQRGVWSNNPMNVHNARAMRETFDPAVSNLNVHLDQKAHDMFVEYWPESRPFGLERDSRHAPVHLAMKDVVADEGERWDLISGCDINKHWSAMIGVFRGELRAWFCEVAGAQAMLHQDEEGYPDTGIAIGGQTINGTYLFGDGQGGGVPWWQLSMTTFTPQVRKHCHECAVPLRGYGEMAQAADSGEHTEQTSETHKSVFKPKRKGRAVELVTALEQLHQGRIHKVTQYMQNAQM